MKGLLDGGVYSKDGSPKKVLPDENTVPKQSFKRGGFRSKKRPSPEAPSTVAKILQSDPLMLDDLPIKLKGNIVEHLGGEYYLFVDDTGEIRVEIDDEKWFDVEVDESTKVTIFGEVDSDREITISVDHIKIDSE